MAVLLTLAAAAAPQSADLYDQAARLYSRQQFEQAEHILRHAVQKNPQSAPVRFLLGATLLQLGRNGEAVQELRNANQLNPRNVDAAKLLATEYVGSHQFAEAIQVLRPLMSPGPADEETFLLLIQAYQERGDAGDAECARSLADQALARYPRSARLILWKGSAMREVG